MFHFFLIYIIFYLSRKQKKDENYSLKYHTTQFQHLSILDDSTDDKLSIKYQPKTQETKQIYECLLGFIQERIGDQVCLFFNQKKFFI